MVHELGISQPTYAKIESGAAQVNTKKLVKIAEVLKVKPQELLESATTINQFNTDAASAYSNCLIEHLYQDNKEVYQKMINLLEKENLKLEEEVERLRVELDNNGAK